MKIIPFSLIICFIIPYSVFSEDVPDDIQDISLDDLLNTSISTAAKYEQTMSEAPASVTVITSDHIEKYGYRTLDEALTCIRDFYISYDRVYAYLGTRGFSRPSDYNNRILLLINGHSRNDNVYGSSSIGNDLCMPLDIVERIEVVRGPGSVLYGTGAMFAVVNIITKAAKVIDGFNLHGEIGSYGRLQNSGIFGKEFDNGLKILVSGIWGDTQGQDLYFDEYDDPSTNNGIAEDSDWSKYKGLFTTFGYKGLSFCGATSSRSKSDPTGAWEVVFNNHDSRSIDKRDFFEIKYDSNIGTDKNLMIRGYLDRYFFNGIFPYEETIQKDRNKGRWMGNEIQFRWDLRSNNRMILGVDYQNHFRADIRIEDNEGVYFDKNFPYNALSFYIQDEHQLIRSLSLTAGLRYDRYSTIGSSFIPRAAIIYNPFKSTTLKLLYGQGLRSPNIYEFYYDDQRTQKANPYLSPEKIGTTELILEQQLKKGLFGIISLYKYQMKGLIDQYEVPEEQMIQFQNIGKVKTTGIGFEINSRLKSGLRSYISYSFQNAIDEDTEQRLTNSPEHVAKMGVICPIWKYL
ncbi:hypothetical protein FJZ33_06510, partial [Candidatus Poribacteria bacterium]|nr:hypothetical protein [Candidatus Poribacteria bacterium]